MTTPDTPLGRSVTTILVAMVLALMSWVGYSMLDIKEKLVVISVQQSFIMEKSREIVPRAENERRWQATERSVEQNSDRVAKIEQTLMNNGRR